jgi:hypothetical protein
MKNALASSAAAVALLFTSLSAHAAYVVDLTQVGTNVDATGSGTIDLTDLSLFGSGSGPGGIHPSDGYIETGSGSEQIYTTISGPANFGSGGITDASTTTGGLVAVNVSPNELSVPSGYVSGTLLSNSATFDNATFASLGATPGTYTWTWGKGAHADSFTLQIGPAAVPEPSTWAMMLAGFVGLGFAAIRKGKREARLAV